LVHSMLIVQIDGIDAEPLQRCVAGRAHILGASVDGALVIRQRLVAELGRDYDLVAMLAEDRPDQFLVVADPVNIGGVEKVDPELDRALEGGGRFDVVARTVELRHAHASKSQFRNHESLAAEFSLLHDVPPLTVGWMAVNATYCM